MSSSETSDNGIRFKDRMLLKKRRAKCMKNYRVKRKEQIKIEKKSTLNQSDIYFVNDGTFQYRVA